MQCCNMFQVVVPKKHLSPVWLCGHWKNKSYYNKAPVTHVVVSVKEERRQKRTWGVWKMLEVWRLEISKQSSGWRRLESQRVLENDWQAGKIISTWEITTQLLAPFIQEVSGQHVSAFTWCWRRLRSGLPEWPDCLFCEGTSLQLRPQRSDMTC